MFYLVKPDSAGDYPDLTAEHAESAENPKKGATVHTWRVDGHAVEYARSMAGVVGTVCSEQASR